MITKGLKLSREDRKALTEYIRVRGGGVYKTHDGYARYQVTKDGRTEGVYIHKWVADRAGMDCSETIDHRNRNRMDCRRRNLRPATRLQQMHNRQPTPRELPVGVWRRGNRYTARIKCNGKHVYLGTYKSALAARRAYCKAARRLRGNFSALA